MQKKWEQNLALSTLKYLSIDLVGDFVYWPVWWFSFGAKKWGFFCLQKLKDAENRLGLRIWFFNLTTPMFAQYDWQGRMISFFIRLIVLVFKTIAFIFYAIFVIALFLLWFILPLFVIYQIWINLNHLISIKS
ncbi:hypothetical protein KKA15_04145 [Patescibacteria group bacterium]|nr:hypothetical protein [Patescibacteria group bacterium]